MSYHQGQPTTEFLSGLSCTAFATQEALHKQLVNLHMLRRESALWAFWKAEDPSTDILKGALLLASLKVQFSAAVVQHISTQEETRSHQIIVSALVILVAQKASKPMQLPQCGVYRCGSRGCSSPSGPPQFQENAKDGKRDFVQPGEGARLIHYAPARQWCADTQVHT